MARAGDYMAQRQISFCLMSGCSGAVTVDNVSACAWQTVISANKRRDVTDEHNRRSICSKLTDEQRVTSLSIARKLIGGMAGQNLRVPDPSTVDF